VQLISFGFKYGVPEHSFMIDCRRMANPHFDPELRALTGLDTRVQEFVQADRRFAPLAALAIAAVKEQSPVIAFGCFGGRHRSVAMAEVIAARLRSNGIPVTVLHRQLNPGTDHGPKRGQHPRARHRQAL